MTRKFCTDREALAFLAPRDGAQGKTICGPFDTAAEALKALSGYDIDEVFAVRRIDLDGNSSKDVTADMAAGFFALHDDLDGAEEWAPVFIDRDELAAMTRPVADPYSSLRFGNEERGVGRARA